MQDVLESLPGGGGHAVTDLQMVPAALQLPVGRQGSDSVRGGAEGGAPPVQTHLKPDGSGDQQ